MTKIKAPKKKPIRINYAYDEHAEITAFERLKAATGISSNVELVRYAVRQTMVQHNVRVASGG